MNASLTIRLASVDDADALCPLLEQLGYPMPAPLVRRRLETRGDWEVYVACEGTKTIAMLILATRDDFIDGPEARIEGLVDEHYRSSGVGAQLLAFCDTWARQRGLHAILVRSNVVRTRAHAFYERAGYSKRKSQFLLEKTL
jgi:GNAT superfamily N-acetyltransferase